MSQLENTRTHSLASWRLAIHSYVEQNERNLKRVRETPPGWVRFIAAVLGFCASLLAFALPAIALLVVDRLIPAGDASALWPLFALGSGTLLALIVVDYLRMQALAVYFSNARAMILYQDCCFAVFWALLLGFIHPTLSVIPLCAGAILWLSFKFRRNPPQIQDAQKSVDDFELLDASGLGQAYQKLAASGQIQSTGTLDFQSLAQASWLNFVAIFTSLATVVVAANYTISGTITIGTAVALILINQYLSAIFTRLYQIAALQPKASAHSRMPSPPIDLPSKPTPAADDAPPLLSIQELENNGIAPFSADLFQGLCLALIGPSGSGKSEILRAIATGQFTEGKITYHERNWGRNHPRLAYAAYATVPAVMLPGTVIENITGFDPKASAKTPIEILRKLDPFDDVFQGFDLLNDPIEMGNIGQKQLVSLARLFWQDPEILILDHPETYLDKASRAGLMSLILGAKTKGKIVLMATDDEYLMSLADEVVKLERGIVTDRGPMQEVLDRLHQRWVRVSFTPNEREGFRLGLWLDAQFPRGMDETLKARVKKTAQDMLFFAPRDRLSSDQDEILFDLRVNPDEVAITMHDRGDLMATQNLSAADQEHYERIIAQSDGFDQKLREGYRQLIVQFNTDMPKAS